MDRVISFDRPFTLKIVGNLISNMNYRTCFITEPHSERTSTEIRKSCDINGYVIPFINKYIHDDITTIFVDGLISNFESFETIRNRLNN